MPYPSPGVGFTTHHDVQESILMELFREELIAQNPCDHAASEILARIRGQQLAVS